MKSYITVAPGGHYHDWYVSKDSTILNKHVVLEWEAWGRWFDLARGADTAKAQKVARGVLPDPVSRHGSSADASAERDRLNGALAKRRTQRSLKALSTS